MNLLSRIRGVVGVASAQLHHYRVRFLLAIFGVATAVLLVILLVGLGHGLLTTGQQAIGWIDSDLWLSGGAIAFAPGTVGGVENPIGDAHTVTGEVKQQPQVADAQALAFQTVYVSPNSSSFETTVSVGVTGNGSRILLQQGDGFTTHDVHYANGTYEGPMTHEVIIDPSTAEKYGVGVGDTLYIGGTISQARQTPFTVVGISNTFSTFLGTSTVALHLSELQEVSGTTGTDRASFIRVTLTSGADRQSVASQLEQQTGLTARTNQEQVRAIVGNSAATLAGATALVVLALTVGAVLVVNVLVRVVYEQREQFALLRATGLRTTSLAGLVAVQGVLIGGIGGLTALGLSPVVVDAVNRVAEHASGFPNLIKTPVWIFGLGIGLAVLMGLVGAVIAGYRVARLNPTELLRP